MYRAEGLSMSSTSSNIKYLPCQVSAKIKSNFKFLFRSIQPAPSDSVNFNLWSLPRYCFAICSTAGSLSTEISEEDAFIPSRIQEVDRPVPVPSSRNLPPGFEAASVFKNAHTLTSEAIGKPDSLVALSISE